MDRGDDSKLHGYGVWYGVDPVPRVENNIVVDCEIVLRCSHCDGTGLEPAPDVKTRLAEVDERALGDDRRDRAALPEIHVYRSALAEAYEENEELKSAYKGAMAGVVRGVWKAVDRAART